MGGLLALWRSENTLLTRVVERIPEERLTAPCRVADKAPVPLSAVIEGDTATFTTTWPSSSD